MASRAISGAVFSASMIFLRRCAQHPARMMPLPALRPARSASSAHHPARANSADPSCFALQYRQQRAQMAHAESRSNDQTAPSSQTNLNRLASFSHGPLWLHRCRNLHLHKARSLGLLHSLLPLVELPDTQAALIAERRHAQTTLTLLGN